MGARGECSKELLQLPKLVLSRGQGLTSVCTHYVPIPHAASGGGMQFPLAFSAQEQSSWYLKHYRPLKKVPVPAGTDVLAWVGDRGYLRWVQDQEEGTPWGILVHGSQVSVTQLTALVTEKTC